VSAPIRACPAVVGGVEPFVLSQGRIISEYRRERRGELLKRFFGETSSPNGLNLDVVLHVQATD
jgi:hypothetical protein